MGAAVAKKTCPRCDREYDADAAFCPNDGTPLEPDRLEGPDSDPYIGTLLPGDIEIRGVAGAGAMGRVYRAHQRGIDRDVAVKILHRELSGNLPLVQRFHREARIASRLQHPHVVDVYLAGQLPDGALYIVMEYLDGLSLAAALSAAGGVLPLERAIAITLQICDAVGEGHSRGIVHRDLKPENVMLVRRADTSDWVKVLDFGIAKVSIGDQSMQTAAGLIFGTARYISPEGAQGTTVGTPGDVYSIATILYQLLAGKTPFDAEQPVGLLIKHLHETPPPLVSWPAAAAVPEPIARVVMDNLAKEPEKRAQTARALGNALAAAAKEANVTFADVGVAARMSVFDGARIPSTPAFDPTLDEAAAVPSPKVKVISNPPASPAGSGGTLAIPAVAPPPAADVPNAHVTDAIPSSRPLEKEKRPSAALLVALAFLLGIAVAVLATREMTHRREAEHDEHVAKTRRALAEGRYVSPPGDNVKELVQAGRARWPDDPVLETLESDAAHELVTRAMAARSAGDVGGAHDLAKQAVDLDPTDGAAKLLLAQYDDELAAMNVDGGAAALSGGPRIVLDSPAKARPGVPVAFVGRVLAGGSARPKIAQPQFVVYGPGLPEKGEIVPATGAGPYAGSFTAKREGTFAVQFEANADGAYVRAERMLVVAR